MIYRILHDDSYLMHVIPPVESLAKLGDQYGTFAFNAEPISYKEVWKPLNIEFRACDGSRASTVPDVSENFGRLFLSEKAFEALGGLLECCGECLPVTFNDQKGYIFNPTGTAEQVGAVDEAAFVYDEHGNLAHFEFRESKLVSMPVFKTKLDLYKGIFCFESVKEAYEHAELTGVVFSADVSNPIGNAHGIVQ